MTEIRIAKPYDMHVHLRSGRMLAAVAHHTARHFYRALVMPNLTPPIRTLADAVLYRNQIMEVVGIDANFEPLMTFKIMPDTRPSAIEEFAPTADVAPYGRCQTCVVAGKVYPKGLTTNAHDGVEDFHALHWVFKAMEERNLVLCMHGEMPGEEVMGRDRERAFLRTLQFFARTYPNLRIVMEHITTAAAVDAILAMPDNVAATITVHHLLLTADDVGGDRMCPHHFCKPIAKDPADRAALREAAMSGCSKFFFGSDSAPHPRAGKERGMDCCAGIFTANMALPQLAEIFDQLGALDRLEGFVRNFGGRFYEIGEPASDPPKRITLVKKPWRVPEELDGVVPFRAGEEISWSVKEGIEN